MFDYTLLRAFLRSNQAEHLSTFPDEGLVPTIVTYYENDVNNGHQDLPRKTNRARSIPKRTKRKESTEGASSEYEHSVPRPRGRRKTRKQGDKAGLCSTGKLSFRIDNM